MLPGPVFNVELITTARRPRYFALRVLYGLALLFIVWQNYSAWDRFGGTAISAYQMRQFAQSTFYSIVALQGIGIIAMTPSLCAGVIANEKQRKTLHYLLASQLSSAEIVLGKLLARMLHVAVFLAIGLPVMSLMSLFGGVDPLEAFLATLGSFSTAFFLASLSVLCSTVSKRVREAITMTYLLEGAWIVLPLLVRAALPMSYPELWGVVRPVNDWLLASTPWPALQSASFGRLVGGGGGALDATAWMVGLQVGVGLLLNGLAILRLRPVFRAQEGAKGFRFMGIPLPGGKSRRLRLFGRKPVGDSAMMWKELHTSRTSGAAQIAGLVIGIVVALAVGYGTLYFAWDSIREFMGQPQGTGWQTGGYGFDHGSRGELNAFVRWITTAVGVVMILAAAVGGANTMTSEREDDTWISLVGTPLDDREIVFPKILGVLWKLRWGMMLIGFEWLIGIICGAVHPVGVIFQAIEFVAFMTFAAALGTFFSTTSKSSWRSQATTVGVLVMCSGGYMACCCPLAMQSRPSSTMLMVMGIMPFILAVSLVAPWEFNDIFANGNRSYLGPRGETGEVIAACFLGTILYGVLAVAMTIMSTARFEKAADRPRRDEFRPLPPPKPRPKDAPTPEVG